MTERMQTLHNLLHGEEGKKLDANGNHIAHLVNGKWHIAYGHLLDAEQTEEELEVMGLEDELDDWERFTVDEEQAVKLFEVDVEDALHSARYSFTDEELDYLDNDRWAVIISMCFQLGSVTKFKSFIKAVKESDWTRASDEMMWSNGLRKQKRSAWFKETPKRCQRAADIMRGTVEQDEPYQPPTVPDGILVAQISDRVIAEMKQYLPEVLEEAMKGFRK